MWAGDTSRGSDVVVEFSIFHQLLTSPRFHLFLLLFSNMENYIWLLFFTCGLNERVKSIDHLKARVCMFHRLAHPSSTSGLYSGCTCKQATLSLHRSNLSRDRGKHTTNFSGCSKRRAVLVFSNSRHSAIRLLRWIIPFSVTLACI